MSKLPHKAILDALYDALTAALPDEDVRHAGAGGEAPAKYIALQFAPATKRDTLTSTGYDVTIQVRCHTEHPTGYAGASSAYQYASTVADAMDGISLNLGSDQAALYIDETPTPVPSQYEMGDGRSALDIILQYEIKTQFVGT